MWASGVGSSSVMEGKDMHHRIWRRVDDVRTQDLIQMLIQDKFLKEQLNYVQQVRLALGCFAIKRLLQVVMHNSNHVREMWQYMQSLPPVAHLLCYLCASTSIAPKSSCWTVLLRTRMDASAASQIRFEFHLHSAWGRRICTQHVLLDVVYGHCRLLGFPSV